jgi:uncharacterized membrane protein YfcA
VGNSLLHIERRAGSIGEVGEPVHLDGLMVLASALVGFLVGLTGMGGGALMTPMLVLVFGVPPLAAISSDLVASVVMRPVGGLVHLRRGTVNLGLVRWLMLGSVPAAFCGVLVLRSMGSGPGVESAIQILLGATLVVGALAIAAKAWIRPPRGRGRQEGNQPIAIRPGATLAVGVVGGLVVGMTSVGAGSMMVVLLLALYPALRLSELVGTDLVQAIPLTVSAALGHLVFGDVRMAVTASLLVGSLPAVYIGARLSSRAPDHIIRPVLSLVLVLSGLKLLNVSNAGLGIAAAALVGVGGLWLLARMRLRTRLAA